MKTSSTFLMILCAASALLALQGCAELPAQPGEPQARSYEEPVVRLGSNITRRSPEEKSRVQTNSAEALEAMRDQQTRAGTFNVSPVKGN
jgi:hypothetical protein